MELRVGTKWEFRYYSINDILIIHSFDHNDIVKLYWDSSPNNYIFMPKEMLFLDYKQVSSLEVELT